MPRLLVDSVYVGDGLYQNQLVSDEHPIDEAVGQVELTEDELAEYVELTNKLKSLTANLLSRMTAVEPEAEASYELYLKYEDQASKFE